MPLVTSMVINAAHDAKKPWIMELWGHDGKAYNVTMEVGDTLMYESHSVVHGGVGRSRASIMPICK